MDRRLSAPADLIGLVLAGGRGQRLGEDKGRLQLHGISQAEHCIALLEPFCQTVHVSVRAAQAALEPYCRLPLILDDGAVEGPAAGLLAAWSKFPAAALWVLAVDMPLADAALLTRLSAHRNPERVATAYRHPGGIIEPLCTIWEPRAAAAVRRAASARSPSLRRILEGLNIERVEAPDPGKLRSVNTPEALMAVQRALAETPDGG